MSEWKTIEALPDDFDRPGGRRAWKMRDWHGRVFIARRAYFNNSGFHEIGSNREVWPVEYCGPALSPTPPG